MASLGQKFDATQHNTDQTDYENLPIGIYDLEVTASDVVPTKDGSGTMVKLVISVIEPVEYEGRKVFENLSIEHPNAQTQQIASEKFAKLSRACEVTDVEDTEVLHNIRFRAKLGLGKPSKDGQYPARNEIKRFYYHDEGTMPEVGIDAQQPAAKAAPKAANDNRAAAANDNKPAAAAAKPAGRPWGAKK